MSRRGAVLWFTVPGGCSRLSAMLLNPFNLVTPFVAAPMAGVSGPAFRVMARRCGASLVYTEMVSAEGLLRGCGRTWSLTRVHPDERPVGLQLFGGNPESMGRAAALTREMPIDLVDINLGCPVRKVRHQGAGSALLDDPVRAAEVVAAVRENAAHPVTVKLRLGFRGDVVEKVLPGLLDAGAAAVCLHARTVKQGYGGQADWKAIARLAAWCPVPVIGNGDVTSPELAKRMLDQTGCAAVMIGRGALGNPWIFDQAAQAWQGRAPDPVPVARRRSALWEHMELARELEGENYALHFTKQFMMWYSKGLPGSSAFRHSAGATRALGELLELCAAYFDRLQGAES